MKTAILSAALLALPVVSWAGVDQQQKTVVDQKVDQKIVQEQVGQQKIDHQQVGQQQAPVVRQRRSSKSTKGVKGVADRLGAKFDRATSKTAKGTKGTKGTKGVKGGAAQLPDYAQKRVEIRKQMQQFVQSGQYEVPAQNVELKAQAQMIRQDMFPEAQTDRQAIQWYLQETR